MNKMALKVAGIVFLLIGLVHFFRVIFKVSVVVNGHPVPLWLSIVGGLFTILLSTWMFRESK